jgi:hypothetical protein
MDLTRFTRIGEEAPGLRFLVIGGIAVISHGYSRLTLDVDFLVRRAEEEEWEKRILQAGFSRFKKTGTFAQYSSSSAEANLDLMFVNDPTFEQFWSAAVVKNIQGKDQRIPTLDHLIALKLHALKYGPASLTLKDANDIEMLCRLNNVNILTTEYEGLFLKYGTREIYETLCRVLRHL